MAGISFRYEIPNTKNEVLLLVDSSFSSQEAQQKKDEFIRSAIDEKLDSVKMGIVTFGYNQIYAAELTYDADELFSQYLEAQQPDDSATDVASALEYASRLFSNPETAKIVLISDGAETDRKASTIIKSIAAEGIKVDTVLIPEEERGAETELIGVTYPEEKIIVNQKFSLGITVQSSFEGKAKIVLYDNDEKVGEIAQIDLVEGIQTIEFEHTFTSAGLHKISFSIESDEDTLAENNSFYSYVYLEVFDDILIIERNENESSQLKGILEQSYNVNVVNILEGDGVPETVDELREYDQVILVNIANADMPRGFDEILNSYVYEFGGGLFTVGGNKTDGATGETVANTYNRQDKAFSYSAEYNMFIDEEACRLFLTELAEDGKGAAVSEAWEIFETFTNTLKKSFDPRYWFIAIALILFLLDIAVRKFKFKWPHEIIRDRKLKKLLSQDKQNVPKEKL